MENLDKILTQPKDITGPIICMGLFKMGEFMVALSGKVGGSVNSHNRGGAYVKNFVMPTNPSTVYQIDARNIFTTNSQAWRGLTQAQRNAWIAAAPEFPYSNAMGDTKILSGNALYNKLNINLMVAGLPAITSPPSPAGVVGILTNVPTYIAGVISIAFTPTPVTTGQSMLLWATPGVSPGVSYVKNKYRLLKVFPAATASPITPIAAYLARFGAASVGSKVFFGLQPINNTTGETGLMLTASTIVA